MDNHHKPTSNDTRQDCFLPPNQSFCIKWQHLQVLAQNDKTHAERVFREFILMVESSYRKQHSPKFYADRLNMTKSNLRKICQKVVGVPPSVCINTRLILEACTLLNTKMMMKEIALELGFESPKYFARFFKKHNRQAPGTYRKFILDTIDS